MWYPLEKNKPTKSPINLKENNVVQNKTKLDVPSAPKTVCIFRALPWQEVLRWTEVKIHMCSMPPEEGWGWW